MTKHKRWMVVFGPPGNETSFIAHPEHPGHPGWTHSRKFAREHCPPGGRVVDADKWVADYKARLQAEPPRKQPRKKGR